MNISNKGWMYLKWNTGKFSMYIFADFLTITVYISVQFNVLLCAFFKIIKFKRRYIYTYILIKRAHAINPKSEIKLIWSQLA
jgi:hypothetical protein